MKVTLEIFGWLVSFETVVHKTRRKMIQDFYASSENGEPGYVYLLERKKGHGDPAYKIGCTNNLHDRLRQLMSESDGEYNPICAVKVMDKFGAEKAFHNLFWHRNIIGEWFSLSRDDIAMFRNIADSIGEYINKDDLPDHRSYGDIPDLEELKEFLHRGSSEGFSRRYWIGKHINGERVSSNTWRWWIAYLSQMGIVSTQIRGRNKGTRLIFSIEEAITKLEHSTHPTQG